MAIITLNPGESFEHYHLEESQTIHESGNIELSFNDHKIILEDKQSVKIPAKTSHSTTNIGKTVVSFQCNMHVVTEEI